MNVVQRAKTNRGLLVQDDVPDTLRLGPSRGESLEGGVNRIFAAIPVDAARATAHRPLLSPPAGSSKRP